MQQRQQARLREHREESTTSRPGPAVEAEKDDEEEQVIYVMLCYVIEEISEDPERTQEYDYIKTREPAIAKPDPSPAIQLQEQASVASLQGFLQQTSFEASDRNSPHGRKPGSSSSDNAPEKILKSAKEEEMEVVEEERDSNIIPPSKDAESRITPLCTSVSGSCQSAQLCARKSC